MNLYCRIPFGRQHSHAPEVIKLARKIGRTPGSVAMKLNNFTSLDHREKSRGIRGLTSVSRLDRQVWSEFHEDWEKLAEESEKLWQSKIECRSGEISKNNIVQETNLTKTTGPKIEHTGPTEGERMTLVRYAQGFFRRTVLTAYGVRCCISGLPVPDLLIASHILPWSQFPKHRVNPRNGLCLSRLHDAAFDQGLIAIDSEYRLMLSGKLKEYLPNDSLQQNFISFQGYEIRMPEKFLPEPDFLSYHRRHIFRG
ncbi:MAG: HNH endonuclease [Deltaproteobacteria bacterium]|nr:HNH endonuclease [Deltaproteobacteria bacterium]